MNSNVCDFVSFWCFVFICLLPAISVSPVWVLLLFHFWVVNPSRCFLSVYLILLFHLIVVSFSPSVFFFRCVLHPLPLPLSSCLGCIPPLIRLPFLRFVWLSLVCFYCLCDFVCVFYLFIYFAYRDDVLCWLLSCPFSSVCFPCLSPISGLIWFGNVYLVTTAGFVADQLM